MSISSEQNSYNILDLGFDKTLVKPSLYSQSSTPEIANVITQGVAASNLVSGDMIANLNQPVGVIFSGKTVFDNTETGYRLGIDSDGLAKLYIGNTTEYFNWTGTSLVIAGGITATAGTIGGFSIGSDYIIDAADSFGLASTVTAGDDVRFFAGSTYANRATAPFRVTEAGALVATSATISGYIINSKGAFGGDGSDGDLTVSGSTSIDADAANYIVKYYEDLTIDAAGTLTLTDANTTNGTVLHLKISGNFTWNGTINLAGFGGVGGASATSEGGGNNGSVGSFSLNPNTELSQVTGGALGVYDVVKFRLASSGGGGTRGSNAGALGYGGGGGGGAGSYANGSNGSDSSDAITASGTPYGFGGKGGLKQFGWDGGSAPYLVNHLVPVCCGSGGGSGGNANNNNDSGAGGNGGGGILIEVAGNVTIGAAAVVNLSATNGADATGNNDDGAGGGGGGSGGIGVMLYNGTLTDNGLTKTVTAGTGGAATGNSGAGGAGAAGRFEMAKNISFA